MATYTAVGAEVFMYANGRTTRYCVAGSYEEAARIAREQNAAS